MCGLAELQLAKERRLAGRRIYDLAIAWTVMDNGATEIWTNDRHFAAPAGLLIGAGPSAEGHAPGVSGRLRRRLAPAWGPRSPMPVLRSRGPRLHCLPGAVRPAEFRGPSRRLCPQCKRRDPRDPRQLAADWPRQFLRFSEDPGYTLSPHFAAPAWPKRDFLVQTPRAYSFHQDVQAVSRCGGTATFGSSASRWRP